MKHYDDFIIGFLIVFIIAFIGILIYYYQEDKKRNEELKYKNCVINYFSTLEEQCGKKCAKWIDSKRYNSDTGKKEDVKYCIEYE